MSTIHVNLKQSHIDNEEIAFRNASCATCADLKYSIYVIYSDIEKAAKDGCPLCHMIQQGLLKFEAERKRLEDRSSLIDLEVSEGQTLRVTTQYVFDNAAEASDPPIYEFFTRADQKSPCPAICSSIDFNDSPLSARWHEIATLWLRECVTTHENCSRFGPKDMPSRALDITHDVRLLDTAGTKGVYVCLSYCWGQGLNLCTTRANLEQMKEGIRWSTIPKTLQQAIMIARVLRAGYIWIDSLCIIQDDKEDWERESARMASIYQNAFLTIAATSSTNTGNGCFGNPDPRVREVHQIPVSAEGSCYPVFVRRGLGHQLFHQMHQSDYTAVPLLGRAWAFQEHLLSTRVIQFTFSELLWECNERQRCECGGIQLQGEEIKQTHSRALKENTIKSLSTIWGVIVQKYTSLGITCDSDRLPALSGIAKQFEELGTLGKYHAGLWERDFVRSLLWFNPNFNGPSTRPLQYRAPSWSWASVQGTSHLSLHLLEGFPTVRVLDIYTKPSGTDSTGACKTGACGLKGIFVKANVTCYVKSDCNDEPAETDILGYNLCCGSKEIWKFLPDVHLLSPMQLDQDKFKLEVTLLAIGREPGNELMDCFLVLEKTLDEPPSHERIGMTRLAAKSISNHINMEDFQVGEFWII